MGKSAEAIEEKGVAMAPLCKRVRRHLITKKIEEERSLVLKSSGRRDTAADLFIIRVVYTMIKKSQAKVEEKQVV